jgi:hypothetical protein
MVILLFLFSSHKEVLLREANPSDVSPRVNATEEASHMMCFLFYLIASFADKHPSPPDRGKEELRTVPISLCLHQTLSPKSTLEQLMLDVSTFSQELLRERRPRKTNVSVHRREAARFSFAAHYDRLSLSWRDFLPGVLVASTSSSYTLR